jgi:hypothetical protein
MNSEQAMLTKTVKRTIMLAMFVGGPTIGWFINGDRGAMFGLVVSVLAIGWFLLEERKIV